jgi:hypothetical protein
LPPPSYTSQRFREKRKVQSCLLPMKNPQISLSYRQRC